MSEQTIEVTCPKCGAKSQRYSSVLKICITGCPKCKHMWEHEFMKKEDERKELLKKMN